MKLAFLVGANPKKSQGGPYVSISKCSWRVILERVQNSKLHFITLQEQNSIEAYDGLVLNPGIYKVKVTEPGDEPYVSVYAVPAD